MGAPGREARSSPTAIGWPPFTAHGLGAAAGRLDPLADPVAGARELGRVAPRRWTPRGSSASRRAPRARSPSAAHSVESRVVAMRRLFLLVSAVVLVDTMFFAAVAPLLPHFADELGLSKTASGVLTAAYPAGTFVGSIPAGWLASRWGVKPTLLLGLLLLGHHEPRLRLREHDRAAGRGALRPGHRRRLHVGGRHVVARVGRAARAAWRADRLGPGGGDRRRAVRTGAGRRRDRGRAGGRVQRCRGRSRRPGRMGMDHARGAARGQPGGAGGDARPGPSRRAGRLLAVHPPGRIRRIARGARAAAPGRPGRQRRRDRSHLPGGGGLRGRDQPDRRAPVRPARAAGADPRGADRGGGDGRRCCRCRTRCCWSRPRWWSS